MDLRKRIAEQIAKHEGMTIRSLSIQAGLSDSALHKFMTKQTKSLTTDNLEKIAAALGVSVRELWWGNGDGKISYIWDHIPDERKPQALRILESFAEEEETADKTA
jgi:lambda repressor-like predicted transcriptional regulator